MKNLIIVFATAGVMLMSSCVSQKKFKALESKYTTSEGAVSELNTKLQQCEWDNEKYKNNIENLKEQKALIKENQQNSIKQIEDLTRLSQSANNNIGDAIAQLSVKDKYINGIRGAMTRKDSINLTLALDLKKVLAQGIQDEDIIVDVEKTVVYISISDKLLFTSGSSNISEKAKALLSKVAEVISSKPEMDVMVEGYTDNVPMNSTTIQDNWELSTLRATSVIRVLQNDYGIDPARLIAAGRSEYLPIATNDTPEGRSKNRRTRIVILPKLDQFFDVLEKTPGKE
ncbi:MAG: chemotaxis protein MotB [Planctomycetota bacterium]|jgi:chemotaxis protein MotB